MKIRVVFLLSVLFLIATGIWAQGSGLGKALAVVTLYETEEINSRQFQKQLDRLQQRNQLLKTLESVGAETGNNQALSPDALLDAEIERILIRQAAKKAGVVVADTEVSKLIDEQRSALGPSASLEAFEAYIKQQSSMSLDEYRLVLRDGLLQRKMIAKEYPQLATNQVTVSEADILDLYEQRAASFISPRIVRYRYIIIDTSKMNPEQKKQALTKMDGFKKEIQTGKSAAFESIIKRAVLDTSFAAGDIGRYIGRNTPVYQQLEKIFGSAFCNTLFALNEDEISGIIESNLGYQIVQVTYKRAMFLAGLDDPVGPEEKVKVRDAIREALLSQRLALAQKNAGTEFIEKLKKIARIVRFKENYTWN